MPSDEIIPVVDISTNIGSGGGFPKSSIAQVKAGDNRLFPGALTLFGVNRK
jgi:hypothetical protein